MKQLAKEEAKAKAWRDYKESCAKADKVFRESCDKADEVYEEALIADEEVHDESRAKAKKTYEETPRCSPCCSQKGLRENYGEGGIRCQSVKSGGV